MANEQFQKVIVISEENHGVIGIAKDIWGAFCFIIENGWLYPYDTMWDKEEKVMVSCETLMEQYELNDLFTVLLFVKDSERYSYDGLFHFREDVPIWEYKVR